MTDIVKGMARAYDKEFKSNPLATYETAMRAALLWLAENASDEMADALFTLFGLAAKPTFWPSQHSNWDIHWCKTSIAAAIRAAAGEK